MTSADPLPKLKSRGIRLHLTPDNDGILAHPADVMPQELEERIRANYDAILRKLLFEEALRFLYGHPDLAHSMRGSSRGRPPEFAEADRELNEAWLEENLEDFKTVLRSWLRTGLRAYKERGKKAASGGTVSDAAGHATRNGPADRGATEHASAQEPFDHRQPELEAS